MRRRLVAEHFLLDGTPKRRFATKMEVRAFLDDHPAYRSMYRYYRCSFCGDWHLAKKKGVMNQDVRFARATYRRARKNAG